MSPGVTRTCGSARKLINFAILISSRVCRCSYWLLLLPYSIQPLPTTIGTRVQNPTLPQFCFWFAVFTFSCSMPYITLVRTRYDFRLAYSLDSERLARQLRLQGSPFCRLAILTLALQFICGTNETTKIVFSFQSNVFDWWQYFISFAYIFRRKGLHILICGTPYQVPLNFDRDLWILTPCF